LAQGIRRWTIPGRCEKCYINIASLSLRYFGDLQSRQWDSFSSFCLSSYHKFWPKVWSPSPTRKELYKAVDAQTLVPHVFLAFPMLSHQLATFVSRLHNLTPLLIVAVASRPRLPERAASSSALYSSRKAVQVVKIGIVLPE
jgi:hypothetical protein